MSEKIYIAKGKQVKDMDLVNITLDLNKLLEHAYNYKGKDLVNITVAKMKAPDQFQKTHTIYINNYQPSQEEE